MVPAGPLRAPPRTTARGSASPRRPPGSSTSAAPGPRSTTGSIARHTGGDLRPAHRGHRHRAQPRGVGRRHPVVAVVARHGSRRGALPPVGAHRRLPRPPSTPCGWRVRSTPVNAPATRSTPAPRPMRHRATTASVATGASTARGGRCGSGSPTGDDGGPRPHPRRRGLRPRVHRGLRGGEVVGRTVVPARQRGRRHRHAHHPRHPRRGPPAVDAQGPPPVVRARGSRRRPARVRPSSAARERAPAEAVQAPRRRLGRVLSGPRLSGRRHAQLPGPARME